MDLEAGKCPQCEYRTRNKCEVPYKVEGKLIYVLWMCDTCGREWVEMYELVWKESAE